MRDHHLFNHLINNSAYDEFESNQTATAFHDVILRFCYHYITSYHK